MSCECAQAVLHSLLDQSTLQPKTETEAGLCPRSGSQLVSSPGEGQGRESEEAENGSRVTVKLAECLVYCSWTERMCPKTPR